MPITSNTNPDNWTRKDCHELNLIANDTIQMMRVLQLSRTIRVVALISCVTLMPEKLKNAILTIFPVNENKNAKYK